MALGDWEIGMAHKAGDMCLEMPPVNLWDIHSLIWRGQVSPSHPRLTFLEGFRSVLTDTQSLSLNLPALCYWTLDTLNA